MPKWLTAETTAAQNKGRPSIYKPENQEEEDRIQPRAYARSWIQRGGREAPRCQPQQR